MILLQKGLCLQSGPEFLDSKKIDRLSLPNKLAKTDGKIVWVTDAFSSCCQQVNPPCVSTRHASVELWLFRNTANTQLPRESSWTWPYTAPSSAIISRFQLMLSMVFILLLMKRERWRETAGHLTCPPLPIITQKKHSSQHQTISNSLPGNWLRSGYDWHKFGAVGHLFLNLCARCNV